MITLLRSVQLSLSVALLVVVLAGCSGGGSGSPTGNQPAGSGSGGRDDGSPGISAGPPFIGRMVGTRRFDNTLLGVDLETGRFSTLAGNNFLLSQGFLRDEATVLTRRDRSRTSGMLVTVDDCLEQQDEAICFFFLDRDGNTTERFAINGEFPGAGKVSFDGTHMVVDRSDRQGGLSTISIFTREGEFVSSHAQSGSMQRSGPYDFLPDGRLVYALEGSELRGDPEPTGFVFTNPFDAAPQQRITLPDFYQGGTIRTIESSPDGRQLLINIEPSVGPTRPILVDTQSLSITQFVDPNDTSIDIKSTVWGPEGRWVYAVISTEELLSGAALDSSQGETIAFIGRSDTLFAFEINGTTHPMPLSQSALSDSVRLMPTDSPGNPGGAIGAGEYDGNLVWIP